MKVAKYAGIDKVDLIENEEYGYCSLIKAAKSVLDRLEIENKTLTKITSKERLEKRLVDPIALREAVINAIIHNDYALEAAPVVEIFTDRIQITSHGGLPMGLSVKDFFSCRSMPRNRELMRVFKDIGLVEQLGSGMGRILKAYDQTSFELTDNFVVVTFRYPEGYITQDNQQDNRQIVISRKILEYCTEPRSRWEIADMLGVKDVRNLTEKHISTLIDNGKLRLTLPNKPTSRNQRYVAIKSEVSGNAEPV